jgi:hypothetical protein
MIVNVVPPSVEASAVIVAVLPEAASAVPLTTQLYSPMIAEAPVDAVHAPAVTTVESDETSLTLADALDLLPFASAAKTVKGVLSATVEEAALLIRLKFGL